AEDTLQHYAAADHGLAAEREQHEAGAEDPHHHMGVHGNLTRVPAPCGSAADRRPECLPRVPEQDETCSRQGPVQRGYRCDTARSRQTAVRYRTGPAW